MIAKFFRNNNPQPALSRATHLSLSPFSLLRSPGTAWYRRPNWASLSAYCLLLTATFPAVAQNGVTVSNLVMDAGTVTFNVSWKNTGMPAIWSDTVWVWVDYNDAGTMTRLPLSPGSTLTTHTAPDDVGKVIEVSGNDKGVWVLGNARSEGSFSATVRLLTATSTAAAACVYASNYPPVGQYTAADKIKFTGTPPFELTFNEGDGATVTRDVAKGTYTIPADRTLGSFIDKTGAPGVLRCTSAALPTVASVTGGARCNAGTVTLSATPSSGAVIDWYSAATNGTPLLSGNNTYTTPSISTSTTYYAQARNSSSGCLSASRTAVGGTISVGAPKKPVLDVVVLAAVYVHATVTSSGDVTWNDNSTEIQRALTTGNYTVTHTQGACISPSPTTLRVWTENIATPVGWVRYGSDLIMSDPVPLDHAGSLAACAGIGTILADCNTGCVHLPAHNVGKANHYRQCPCCEQNCRVSGGAGAPAPGELMPPRCSGVIPRYSVE